MSRYLFLLAALPLAAATGKSPLFYDDVLPVLQARCQECHRAGEAAPMAFTTYKETRPWAKAIREAVTTRKMPPWFADAAHGKFSNDRSLSDDEIKTLVAWADTGAKEGNPKKSPKAAEYADGWTIGKPDVVIEMPLEYTVPATGTVEYTYFLAPTGFTEDKWIEKIELRPGMRSVVHHIVLFARAPGSNMFKMVAPGKAVTEKKSGTPRKPRPDDGTGGFYMATNDTEMISVYVPGGVAYQTRPGQARLIKAGSDLIFQMHYTTNGKEAVDRSKVGIVFAKEAPKERIFNTFIANTNLAIPAGAPNHEVHGRVTLHSDVKLHSMFPHMHLRGKAFEYRVKYPSGETETLLKVPRYDFNWQLTYFPLEQKLLPKGTEIDAVAWFDNSPNNPSNPDPKAEVYWGDQSWEEMLAGFVDFVIPVDMNPSEFARPPRKAAPASAGQ